MTHISSVEKYTRAFTRPHTPIHIAHLSTHAHNIHTYAHYVRNRMRASADLQYTDLKIR